MSAKFLVLFNPVLTKLLPIVYNAKVAGEIAKQVYTKEGMNFPSGAQFAEAQNVVKNN
ncbi:unnamed protein product [Cunninghamella echinulata]